jgi:hypothetical protein
MASLYDLALLAGLYVMFAGFMHGAAMVGAAGVPARVSGTRAAGSTQEVDRPADR